MKNIIRVFYVGLLISLFFACASGKTNTSGNGGAPAIEGKSINGTADVSLKQFLGKVVLINFWATWCPPCRLEIPDLIKLHNTYKGKFTVIGISVDQNGIDGVRDFSKKHGITYPVIMADKTIIHNYGGIEAIPTSFLVDTNGNLVKKYVGMMNFDQYEAEIKPFLPK